MIFFWGVGKASANYVIFINASENVEIIFSDGNNNNNEEISLKCLRTNTTDVPTMRDIPDVPTMPDLPDVTTSADALNVEDMKDVLDVPKRMGNPDDKLDLSNNCDSRNMCRIKRGQDLDTLEKFKVPKDEKLPNYWDIHERCKDKELPTNWNAAFIPGKDISIMGGGLSNQSSDLVLNVSSHLATHGGRMMVVCSRQHVEDMDQTSNVQYM